MRKTRRKIKLKELVLLALSMLGGEANATKLQKATFVLAQELSRLGFEVPKVFKPHYYGPYSLEVEEMAEKLYDEGYIEERRKLWNGHEKIYRLRKKTPVIEKYRVILRDEWDTIEKKIRSIAEMQGDDLLEWIYNEYPEWAKESKIAAPKNRMLFMAMKVMNRANRYDIELLEREYYNDKGFEVVDLGTMELDIGKWYEIAPGIRVKFDGKRPHHLIVEISGSYEDEA
ncbi:MAG: hypothetical protein GSR77_00270 [Desulfurococcales archaeon]|nr:hypothetical protein [Desulfurococcales archaeon]